MKNSETEAVRLYVPNAPDQIDGVRNDIVIDAAQTTEAGHTANFVVFYQTGLQHGSSLAQAVLSTCEADLVRARAFFADATPGHLPFHVTISGGGGGASHIGCAGTAISVGARAARFDSTFIRHLLMAEVVEVLEAAYGRGWNCGASNGEGLSRVLATELYSEPPGFQSAATWLDETPTGPTARCPRSTQGAKRQDWINHNDHTDVCYFSIGCSVLFLNWLRYELGYSWTAIVGAGAASLAQTYTNLTSRTDGWTRFKAVIDQHFPPNRPSGLHNDNPFPLPRTA